MYTDDIAELEDVIIPDGIKDAISDGLKVYFKDFQGEWKELRFSEVNLTPIMKCTTELERNFGKRDYTAERKKWIKRFRKSGKKM